MVAGVTLCGWVIERKGKDIGYLTDAVDMR
jgi:hypothetical protein